MDKYDSLCGTELKKESKKRGLPLPQNKAAFMYRIALRLDDQGKIPQSLKNRKPGSNKIPDFYELLNLCHNNSVGSTADNLLQQ